MHHKSIIIAMYIRTYVLIPTYTYLSHAGHANLKDKVDTLQDKVDTLQDKVDTLQDKADTLQDKVGTLQDKVDTLQDKMVNLEDKLDTFQNTTEASTRKHHHEVVELLQNTSCSSDGKIWSHSQAPTLQTVLGPPNRALPARLEPFC